MGNTWRIIKSAVEQEILFPDKSEYERYVNKLENGHTLFQVISVAENSDGTVTVHIRKSYNATKFWEKEEK